MDDEDYADNSDGGGMSDMEEYDPDAPSEPVAAAASESKTGSLELEQEAAELAATAEAHAAAAINTPRATEAEPVAPAAAPATVRAWSAL